MGWHTVYHEDIQTIAFVNGIRDWRAIWDHPENARLRETRPNPLLLAHGDAVFVPDDTGSVVVARTGSLARFQMAPEPSDLRSVSLIIRDSRGNPFVEKRFQLSYGDGLMEGMTSDRGEINCFIPYNQSAPILSVFPRDGNDRLKLVWPLQLGWLEPVDTVAGIKGRLHNLGYRIETIDNTESIDLHEAVRLFRARNSLPVSQEIDSQFRQRLQEDHGGI